MSKVISIQNGKKDKSKVDDKKVDGTKGEFSFEEIMKQNDQKKKKLEEERRLKNKSTLRDYRIK